MHSRRSLLPPILHSRRERNASIISIHNLNPPREQRLAAVVLGAVFLCFHHWVGGAYLAGYLMAAVAAVVIGPG